MFCSSPEPAAGFYFLGPRTFLTQRFWWCWRARAVPTGMSPWPSQELWPLTGHFHWMFHRVSLSLASAEIPFGNRPLLLNEAACASLMSFYCKAEPLTCDSLRTPIDRVLVILYSAGFYCSVSKFKLLFCMFFSFLMCYVAAMVFFSCQIVCELCTCSLVWNKMSFAQVLSCSSVWSLVCVVTDFHSS